MIYMKKKLFAVLSALTVCVSGAAFAAPQTTFQEGAVQVDVGAWNPKSDIGDFSSDSNWNFQGGITYGLTDDVAIQYQYAGLKTDVNGYDATTGNQQEVNLLYSLNDNVAAYAGYNRIENEWDHHGSTTNNVLQVGLIGKAPLADNLDLYGKVGVGTKNTTTWEAGLSYGVTPDLDINAGYRYVDTEGRHGNDSSVTYKGFVTGISYRFGGF